MILFFGTRPGKTEIEHLQGVACPYCEQVGTLTISRRSNWIHLFWIKLFRISSDTVAECSHCKRIYYQEEFNEPMQRALEPH